MEEIDRIGEGIRSLEIQGARNVAISGLSALRIAAHNVAAETPVDLLAEMRSVARKISLIRVTEPGLRNVLANVLSSCAEKTGMDTKELRKFASERCEDMLEILKSNISKIIEKGSPLIEDGSTIYTHCHSSSVTSLIIAESKRKDVRVICSETRPRWQGRKTARELADHGVDTTLFVDSAIHMYQPEADMVLIGSDAVGGGFVYNKIGSYMVMEFANKNGIPSYSVCETQKFDPLVGIGYVQPVEQRPQEEVIEGDVPFKVRNPAFERVPIEMFTGIISEIGILDPSQVDEAMHNYDYLIPELKKLVDWEKWDD